MGQMLVEGGNPDANLARACAIIEQAGEQQADVVVLPECLDLGWTHPSARELAQPIPGEYSRRLCEGARRANIYLVAGLVERAGDERFYAAVLISSDGEILLKHRKINELSIARDIYASGTSLAVARTPFGTIGMTICADNFQSSLTLSQALIRMGAEIILSPCAWAVDAHHDNEREPYGQMWRDAYSTLAKKYDVPVVGVSNTGALDAGPWQGKKCIGCSIAVGAGGELLAQAPYTDCGDDLIVVPITLHRRDTYGTLFDARFDAVQE